MIVHDLFVQAADAQASDIHLTPDQPPVFRVNGNLQKLEADPLTGDDIADLVYPVLPEPVRAAFAGGAVQWAETVATVPDQPLAFHVSVFRSQGQTSASIRLMLSRLPTVEQIGDTTAPLLKRVAQKKRGLVLFTGPQGSGKVTTASVVIEAINASRAERIFLIEETPGYQFVPRQSVLTRWQIGQDVDSYETAARLLWKCDPDVIYFGDLPTPEAVRHAVLHADAGHLVIATLGAESVGEALAGIIGAFGQAAPTLRKVLARALVAAFNQRLLPRSDRPGRAALYEVLWAGTPEVRAVLEAGSQSEWEGAMEADETSRTRTNALADLQAHGIISAETAQSALAAL